MEGIVPAVDVARRVVVLEVNTAKGDLTAGVTLSEAAVPKAAGCEVPLAEVAIGETAKLKYTRQDGRLVGLELQLKR